MGDHNFPDNNFSRGFETIADNTESVIGDSIHSALDRVLELMREREEAAPELVDTARDRDVVRRITETNNILGENYLDVGEIFRADTRRMRKSEKINLEANSTLEHLNNCIRKCPVNKLSEIYFKRGEVLFKAKKYEQAIVDFKESLEFSLNENNNYIIYNKIAQSLAKTGQIQEAVNYLKLSLQSVSTAEIRMENKKSFTKSLMETIRKFEDRPDKTPSSAGCDPDHGGLLTMGQENPECPGVSALVAIRETETQGRHAVALEDIAPGTVVAAGRPTVALLNPDNRSLVFVHCLNCLAPITAAPHPCLTCASCVFCSPECRSRASGSFHRYQCQLNLYHHRQVDTEDAFNIFMVLQTLWQKPFSYWRQNFSDPGAKFTGDEDALDLEYLRYWRMMRHIEARSEWQFLKIIIISVFLTRLTRMTSYIHDDDDAAVEVKDVDELRRNVPDLASTNKPFTATETFLAEIIVNIFLIQDSNSHPVFRLDAGASRNQIGLETIGSGVFPVIGSFFNHSCCPNTIRVNVGKMNYVVTSASIPRGAEVTDIYSMHFSEIPRAGRQSWLRDSFHFVCQCPACSSDWPTFDNLESVVSPELRQKLEIVEKCIATALRNNNLESVVEFHKKDILLLESAGVTPHKLQISLRNSFQFALWRFLTEKNIQ